MSIVISSTTNLNSTALYRTVCSIRPALVVNLVKGSRNKGQAWGCPNNSRHADHQYIRLKKSTYWSSLPLTSAFIALTYHNRFKCYLAWAISLQMTTPNTYVLYSRPIGEWWDIKPILDFGEGCYHLFTYKTSKLRISLDLLGQSNP